MKENHPARETRQDKLDKIRQAGSRFGLAPCPICDGRGKICRVCNSPAPPGHFHIKPDTNKQERLVIDGGQIRRCSQCNGAGLYRPTTGTTKTPKVNTLPQGHPE